MPAEVRLSPKARRTVLEQLSRDRLRELTTRFGLEVTDRRSTDSYVDAIVRKHSLDFGALLEELRREELQAACEALGLDSSGREKAKLVARILGGAPAPREEASPEPSNETPPDSLRNEGALKSMLRRFVLALAGGLRGRDAATTFTSRLLQCFGWPAAGPPGVTMPTALTVVEGGRRTQRDVALFWQDRRVLLDVVKHDVMLDFAWKDLLRVCLQIDPVPQYVVLTNQRDLQLYDLARDREAPRLSIPLDDLPKYSEAFPFLSPTWRPGEIPKIINVSKVSGEVAELVARLYRSLKEAHPKQEREVVQFTLQCILTMFAEDIGLLPQEYFTTLLYEGARHRDTGKRLAELFRLMGTRDVSGQRPVPYFNGGLFTNPVALPLGDLQLAALTKAAEASWKYVDPHIFGSVFQGIMDDAERHKSGAHYTAHEDIMRVVGPTIVEPWRQRIRDAKSLAELLEVRAALLRFRVLDPACGSGNFLYVSFRELYRLDTELLARIREFPSTQGQGKAKVTWGAGIQTSNFFGIDINPFAVELAKVTLNIAKKIAFDERREMAADLAGQMELEVDPSLPLDNLDKNVVCADALFTDWPEVEAIVGNPPFLGEKWIRKHLGAQRIEELRERFPGVGGDLFVYWFRRAHAHLHPGGRAGLVAQSNIRVGGNRAAALDYIIDDGGVITNAVSERNWPGEAAVHVSMVNWHKGPIAGPHKLIIGEQVFERDVIPSHLQLHGDVSSAVELRANLEGTCQGITFGSKAFHVDTETARALSLDSATAPFVKAVANGDDLLRGTFVNNPEWCVYIARCESEGAASSIGGKAFAFLKSRLLPEVRAKADTYPGWLECWWQPLRPRREFMDGIARAGLRRIVACSRLASRPIFFFLSNERIVPLGRLQLFAFGDDYAFGVIQSSLHWEWAKAKGGRLKSDIVYATEVWRTFPWPQEPREAEVAAVAATGRELRRVRDTLMKENGWSLRALYQAAEIPGSHPLKDAQAALDLAVQAAYGMPADQEATEFLLELNKLVAEDEAEGRAVQGPGVPKGMDPRDPRWTSDDCIMPPNP